MCCSPCVTLFGARGQVQSHLLRDSCWWQCVQTLVWFLCCFWLRCAEWLFPEHTVTFQTGPLHIHHCFCCPEATSHLINGVFGKALTTSRCPLEFARRTPGRRSDNWPRHSGYWAPRLLGAGRPVDSAHRLAGDCKRRICSPGPLACSTVTLSTGKRITSHTCRLFCPLQSNTSQEALGSPLQRKEMMRHSGLLLSGQ